MGANAAANTANGLIDSLYDALPEYEKHSLSIMSHNVTVAPDFAQHPPQPLQYSPIYSTNHSMMAVGHSIPHSSLQFPQQVTHQNPSARTVGVATKIAVATVQPAIGRNSQQIGTDEQMDSDLEQDEDDDFDDGRSTAPNDSVKGARKHTPRKGERRTAHNLIEKKYRCSINDRIDELRQLVCNPHVDELMMGASSKMSKSATLKRAIDYIDYLQHENHTMRAKMQRLRREMTSVTGVGRRHCGRAQQNAVDHSESPEIAVAPIISASDTSSSISSSSSSPAPVRKPSSKLTRVTNSTAMSDRTRVTLFSVTLLMMFANPFTLLFGQSTSVGAPQPTPVHPSSRTLMGIHSGDTADFGELL